MTDAPLYSRTRMVDARSSNRAFIQERQVMCGCLKIYFRSKPGNDSTPSNAAHIGIILSNRLDQQRFVIQQYIQLDAALGLPGNHAQWEEIRTQTVSHMAQRYGVVKIQRQRLG